MAGDGRIDFDALVIAGHMAPVMRSAPEAVRKRRIKRVAADGSIVGETTLEAVQRALLKAREIEFDVLDGVRPKEVPCVLCGTPVPVNACGGVSKYCKNCRGKCGIAKRHTCDVCKKPKFSQGMCRKCATSIRKIPAVHCYTCGVELCRSFRTRKRAKEKRPICRKCMQIKSLHCAKCGVLVSKATSKKYKSTPSKAMCKPCENRARANGG